MAHIGTVISLPNLIDDAEAAEKLLTHPQIAPHKPIGGEMELYQIADAAEATGKHWLLAKAICDFAGLDGPKTKDAQPLAAKAAADCAAWLLRQDVMDEHLGETKQAPKQNIFVASGGGLKRPRGAI